VVLRRDSFAHTGRLGTPVADRPTCPCRREADHLDGTAAGTVPAGEEGEPFRRRRECDTHSATPGRGPPLWPDLVTHILDIGLSCCIRGFRSGLAVVT